MSFLRIDPLLLVFDTPAWPEPPSESAIESTIRVLRRKYRDLPAFRGASKSICSQRPEIHAGDRRSVLRLVGFPERLVEGDIE